MEEKLLTKVVVMSYYLKTKITEYFYLSSGVDFAKYYPLKEDFYKKYDSSKGDLLILQFKTGGIFLGGMRSHLWDSPESYFLDWHLSHEITDLTLLTQGLSYIENYLKDNGLEEFTGFEKRFCAQHSKECGFILRQLYRKIYTEIKNDPQFANLKNINHLEPEQKLEFFKRSVHLLQEALEKDIELRKNCSYAKLENFTKNDALKKELFKKSIKYLITMFITTLFVYILLRTLPLTFYGINFNI